MEELIFNPNIICFNKENIGVYALGRREMILKLYGNKFTIWEVV